MSTTPNLAITLMSESQSGKYATFNDLAVVLDCCLIVVADQDLTAPPVSPAEGDSYLIATGASGDWVGHDGDVAVYSNGGWVFHTPRAGRVYVLDESTVV